MHHAYDEYQLVPHALTINLQRETFTLYTLHFIPYTLYFKLYTLTNQPAHETHHLYPV